MLLMHFSVFPNRKAFFHQPAAQESQGSSQNNREDHIGGVVNIQIHPGKSDQAGQYRSGDAQLFVVDQQGNSAFKRGDGMPGRERKVVRGGYQQGDISSVMLQNKIIGADSRYQWF